MSPHPSWLCRDGFVSGAQGGRRLVSEASVRVEDRLVCGDRFPYRCEFLRGRIFRILGWRQAAELQQAGHKSVSYTHLVRHDAVAWGYARAADARGVDVIQNCEVTGIRIENGKVRGVETTRGFIGCTKLGLAAAGNSSEVAAMAGLKLPIESHVLQAFVSDCLLYTSRCV